MSETEPEDTTDDGAETAELTEEERKLIADDDDAEPSPYTDAFDGVQDPDADPENIDKVEKVDAAADERAEEEGDDA